MPAAISTARLEARISTDLHSMLKRAAELQGRTMTDFVVSAVKDAARCRPLSEPELSGCHWPIRSVLLRHCCRPRRRPLP